MSSSLGGRCRWKIWNMDSLFAHESWLQETSKKAVLSQIEQADKFQEVRSFLKGIFLEKLTWLFFRRRLSSWHWKTLDWFDLNLWKVETPQSVWDNICYVLLFQIVDRGSHSMWSNEFSWEISQCDSISSYVYVYCDDHWTLFSWHAIAPDQPLQLFHWSTEAETCHSWTAVKSLICAHCNCLVLGYWQA